MTLFNSIIKLMAYDIRYTLRLTTRGLNMFHKNKFRAVLAVVLSLLMLVDYAVFAPCAVQAKAQEAKAKKSGIDTKSALIGAAAGAGIALAVPAVVSAVGAAGGVGGAAAAAVGGVAAVAGGVTGFLGGIVGAIGSAIGAIGGFIAGIIGSPLFIPALLVVGACVAGYFIYKHYKNKKAKAGEANKDVIAGEDVVYVTPTDYEMSAVIPGGSTAPVSYPDAPIVEIGGTADEVTISDSLPSASVSQAESESEAAKVEDSSSRVSGSLEEAYQRYMRAYQTYTSLATNGAKNGTELETALRNYREAYNEYITLKNISDSK